MNNHQIESEINAKGLTAPRVTMADIESNIVGEAFFTAKQGATAAGTINFNQPLVALECLTLCVLTLQNGFTVTGESACASPENFDAELGRKIARQSAVAKIWPLMGYALREQLHAA
ncbi:Gp49 family protein [Silvimonas sp. JCM 19000]